jgi:DNA-binding IscR family transcriptional regulator
MILTYDDIRAFHVLALMAKADPQLLEEICNEKHVSPLMIVALILKMNKALEEVKK